MRRHKILSPTDQMNMDENNRVLAEKKIDLTQVSPGLFTKPGYSFAIIILLIFFSEVLVMLFLSYLPSTSLLKEALWDASMLSIILFPLLFLLVLKPMRNYLNQRNLMEKEREKLIIELQDALTEIKTLKGLIPICTWCMKIRDDNGYWKKSSPISKSIQKPSLPMGFVRYAQKKIFQSAFKK